ncbi:ATP-binding protein [Desertivirga brevis]|uniref:ATP-binding protein n=1 Tax=Desertivirga brevis TaxID=2810310 RepID=UPI001A965690|nr:ATP-binding protein [Pedobacter sp. SYSU D00873]
MEKAKRVSVYLFPVLLILITTLIKLNFTEIIGNRTPFLLYGGVVIAATWYSGWRIGLITNIVCVLLVVYFFIEPIYSFYVAPRIVVHLALFILQNTLVILMGLALKKSLKKSQSAETKLKLLLEEACDLIVLRDKNGKATYVSPRVLEITGYTPQEYMELSFDRLVEPEFLEMFTEKLNSISKTPNERQSVLALFKRKDGELRWLEGDVYNYLNREGINALVSHIKDVTHRVELERQKDEFIGLASHELKTPITNIKGFTALAKASIYTDSQKSEALLERSEANIKRLSKLVSDLLDISKINTGKQDYEFETFDLSFLLRDTVQSFALTYSGHIFSSEIESNAIVYGDRNRLEQVIINLIDNAIKYSPHSRQIIIKQKVMQSNVVVSVQDFGIGISEEHLQNIFNRFYRVDSSAMRFQGLGLGLFIAADILKRHQGNFWVESKQGEGSTFNFIIPLERACADLATTDNATFYRDSSISINYHYNDHYLEVRWLGFQTKETVNAAGLRILEYVKKTRAKLVFNDNSQVVGNWSETSDHGGNVWFPLIAEAGVQYFAWILSKNRFSNMAAQRSYEMNRSNIVIRLFDEEEDGLSWLKDQEVKSEMIS